MYRITSEVLKKEKFYYENEVGEYSNLDEPQRKKLRINHGE
jgi:hypothetical protein